MGHSAIHRNSPAPRIVLPAGVLYSTGTIRMKIPRFMKMFVSICLLTACALNVRADSVSRQQAKASAPTAVSSQDPRFDLKTESSPDGILQLTLTDRSEQPITAAVVLFEQTAASGPALRPSDSSFDSVLQGGDSAIQPGDARIFRVHIPATSRAAISRTLSVKAILFADGSSYGDGSWVGRMVQNRKIAWAQVNDALEMINSAKSAGASVEKLAAALDEKDVAFLRTSGGTQLPRLLFLAYGSASAALKPRAPNAGDSTSPDARWQMATRILADTRERLINSKPAVAAPDEIPK